MKKIFSITLLAIIATTTNVVGCDTGDPICVASIVFEKGAALRYNELKDYYCKQNEIMLNEAIRIASERVAKLKKDKGIDHYKDVKNDFSSLKYELVKMNKEKSTVKVTGTFTYDNESIRYHHESKVVQSIDLIHQNGRWLFCSEELAKRGELLSRANNSQERTE